MNCWSRRRADPDEKLAESARAEPRNPYAAGKLVVDLMVSAEATAFGLGTTSLRYFTAVTPTCRWWKRLARSPVTPSRWRRPPGETATR